MPYLSGTHPSSNRKAQVGLVLGPILAGLLFVLLPSSLTPSARILAAILTWVVIFWITEPIPIPITALLGTACVY